ncbi:hypothetical protein BHECKSOX_1306 [Bathymodiolus heckerae thiotrophic gill symbiont]|uniref:hypothetical protein n=1 Tax=Bathymodiolus heckerae thiotrophic gill symbiont TaxID=1052212 RepID=UPI0010B3E7BE|nr:hypothetical protein [Bathymodiolus heckerae thiotrophic gill symbiont]SHN92691.1 hypothetical protein BHECKSOX_1306 [Bathymodiolus heckerae thiotrophic gill symbiont]
MKSKIKIANNLVKSESGIYEGTIVGIGFGEGKKVTKVGRDVEEIVYPRFEFVTEFEGTGESIRIKTYTGTSINSEPVEVLYSGRGKSNEVNVYNRFTTLLMKLGMLTENDLASVTAEVVEKIEKDVLELKGQMIKCKIGKDKNGYFAVDFGTLEMK